MSSNSNMIASMADELSSQQTLMVVTHVPPADLVSHIQSSDQLDKDISSSDILQQALDEADTYDSSTLSQTRSKVFQENIQHLTDHSYIHTTQSPDMSSDIVEMSSQEIEDDLETSIHGNKGNTQFDSEKYIISPNVHQLSRPEFSADTYVIDKSNDLLSTEVSDTIDVLDETALDSNALVISENPVTSLEKPVVSVSLSSLNQQYIFKLKDSSPHTLTTSSAGFDISQLKLPAKQTSAPVGSVGNPIQIIQNGNSYHSTQLLTQAQLQQISHVLQRQQAQKVQNGGKSILYDPATNTRIVCRVVHPNEIQKTDKSPPRDNSRAALPHQDISPRGRGRGKRSLGRRRDEDERLANLSKEERDEKKKHRPRTRSGRISKPPSYMVKDYKRIHHLDFDEEPLNDSDGGYSDYQVSDEEGGRSGNKTSSLTPGVTTSKHRSYNCHSCNKAYIGRGGLSRHYRLNPTHGRMPEGEDVSTQDENSNSSLASSILSSSGGYTNNPKNSTFKPQTLSKFENEPSSSHSTTVNYDDSLSERRKSNLREILRNFSEEELVEAALPKIAQVVPFWDFFQKKCDMKSDSLRIFEMLKEFEKFLIEMQRVSHQYLSPAASEDDQGKTIINISSTQIADALSLQTGAYFVKDASNIFPTAAPPSNPYRSPSNADLVHPHIKRKRIDHQKISTMNVEDISTRLPEQILSDAHEEAFSTVNSEFHQQDPLIATLTNVENHNDVSRGSLFGLRNATTVTPSSLSSGCLSAVDTSKPSMFFSTDRAHLLQNIQVRKVQLLDSDSTQQQQLRNIDSNQYSDFALSELAISKELAGNQERIDGNSAIVNQKSYESLNLGHDMGILNSCQDIPQTMNLCSNSSLLQTLVNVSPISNTHSIHNGDLIINGQNASPADILTNQASCLPITDMVTQNSSVIVNEDETQVCLPSGGNPNRTSFDANRELELTHNELAPDTAKSNAEPPQVLKHLMLPDGRVIAVWTPVENTEKSARNQLIQNFLPGNLIILQNPNGTLQVPSNQSVTLEALQTLASAEAGTTTQTFTSV
ncbi:hypothetical protein JTE90_000125 [Oedothorax gibbosus]|uniref:C2H2-type domain-containing protein n=1 Tax=Oedothorax gibbosus TaxID=931172 RepID=A0AAV6V036_9ARAC|nr:hypothetical protein JTE90_000125 [Oedothorax gibbosus]